MVALLVALCCWSWSSLPSSVCCVVAVVVVQKNNKTTKTLVINISTKKFAFFKIYLFYRNSCRRAERSLSTNASSAKVEQRIRAWRHCVGRRQAAKQRIRSAGCSPGDVRRVATQTAWHWLCWCECFAMKDVFIDLFWISSFVLISSLFCFWIWKQIQVDFFFSLLCACVCCRVFWRMRLLRECRESTNWPCERVDSVCWASERAVSPQSRFELAFARSFSCLRLNRCSTLTVIYR